MILVFVAMYGVMFLITQYFQLVLGYSPLSSALRTLLLPSLELNAAFADFLEELGVLR